MVQDLQKRGTDQQVNDRLKNQEHSNLESNLAGSEVTVRWWARPDSNRGPSGVSACAMSLPLFQSPLGET